MKAPTFSNFSGNVIGIFLMVTMVLAGLVLSGFVKAIGNDIDFRLMLVGRFIFSLPILYAFGWYVRGTKLLKINSKKTIFGRVFIGLFGICLWLSAVQTADFGQVTALFQSSAVFVALFAPFFLSEKIGIWRISAIVTGLVGICLVTNPFEEAVSIGVYLALASGINSAILLIILRKLGNTDEPVSVALWHNTIGFIFFTLTLLIYTPVLPVIDLKLILFLVVIGIAGSCLQLTLTYAFKFGEAVVLAPIRYLSVPSAIFAGLIIWAEIPSVLEIIGSVITIVSCLVITWREIIKNKKKI